MKALCLQQPFATLVAQGIKTLETRKWETKYRGKILICSSQTFFPGVKIDKNFLYPQGFALCTADLVGTRPMTKEDKEKACVKLYPKAKVWILQNIHKLKHPFPVKGKMGVFELDLGSQEIS